MGGPQLVPAGVPYIVLEATSTARRLRGGGRPLCTCSMQIQMLSVLFMSAGAAQVRSPVKITRLPRAVRNLDVGSSARRPALLEFGVFGRTHRGDSATSRARMA